MTVEKVNGVCVSVIPGTWVWAHSYTSELSTRRRQCAGLACGLLRIASVQRRRASVNSS
jgi:hypothetical protein